MTAISAGLERIFLAHKDDLQRRVSTVETGVAAIAAGNLGHVLRARAERDAHKLAGSLGTFGLHRGSELASELERSLAPGSTPGISEVRRLSESVKALRSAVDGEYARLQDAQAPASSGRALVHASDADESEFEADDRRELRAESLECGLAPADPTELTSSILVVDDDAVVRHVLVSTLCDAGYDARGVASAREARHALEHERISLLLSDVNMPGETGPDLIRFALREHPDTATLLISAREDPGIARLAMDFGAYGCLTKPVRRSAVLVAVMAALRRRDVETRERTTRLHLEDVLRLRTDALADALLRLEGAASQGRVLQAEILHRWAQSAESRDAGVARHVKRVGRHCVTLGKKLGLHAESLELASLLHDVGKIGIPDSILLKPGPLTADERLAVETHATAGYEMLTGSCSGLLDLAASIAKTHHEKFDGTGYPCGLRGTEIPLEGRIAAVADVFDALTSERAYRPAWSVETTIAYMGRERDKHFDPEILDAFFSSIDEIEAGRSLTSS